MSNDGQDDKNVNNDKVQLNDNNSSNNQDQKDNTSTNKDAITPEAEGRVNDPVGIEKTETNNQQEQSSSSTNKGDTQDKAESVNANQEAPSTKEDKQATKVNVEEKENVAQAGNTPNNVKEQATTNNASTEPDKQDVDSVDKDLKQLLSRIDKGEPAQKLEDAQVENVLNSIKAQMTAATSNYAELGRLAGALDALAASTNNPKLSAAIKSMLNAVKSREEAAKEVIRNDATSENIEAQESIEHKANIEKYTAIKANFHKKLDEDLELLDAAIDPSRATPEQRRILENDLTDAEREELKRKNQLKKEGYEHVYNIKEHAEREIKQNNTKITEIDERLKATKDDNQRQSLEAEKKQYIKTIEERQKELDDHVKDELTKRDKEREKLAEFTKLKERVEKYPEFAQRAVEEHFEMHAAEYDKNPDRAAINELRVMVRKVGLAEKLGVSPDPQEVAQIQSVQKIDERQEVVKQDFKKAINQVHEKYSGRPIPREETDKIASIIVHNEGHPHHIEVINIENMDKTTEKNLLNRIDKAPELGKISPSNTPNKPTKGQDKKR